MLNVCANWASQITALINILEKPTKFRKKYTWLQEVQESVCTVGVIGCSGIYIHDVMCSSVIPIW